MFDRPRCRDWTPLSTQQLRLRNLIQISGHNIDCDLKCNVYFTLHSTTMSAPYYTSDKLDAHSNIVWPEINCPNVVKSSARCICIRVWQHSSNDPLSYSESENDEQCDQSASKSSNKELFLWGVYFSGLVPLIKRSDTRLKENSLVFQMHGGYFTSSECIIEKDQKPLNIVPSLSLNSCSTPKTPDIYINDDKNCDNNDSTYLWYANSLGLDKIDKLQTTIASRSSYNGKESPLSCMNSPRLIDNPFNSLSNECEMNLKIRYLFMEFLKSEIRPSYRMNKLLLLQEKQRKMKYEAQSSKEIIDKICMKSAFCLNLDLFSNKTVVFRYSSNQTSNRGMGKTLSKLLYQEQAPPKPETILKGQELRRQIEKAKFRCRILTQEKDGIRNNIRSLETKLNNISDTNIETESWIMTQYRNLSREKENVYQQKLAYASEKEIYRTVKSSLLKRQHQLLRGLNEIYCIKKSNNKLYTINNVPLPNAESYTESFPPIALSVALGYAAHSILMCSSILNLPIRNPIKHEGSKTKIVDNIKVLPQTDKEFPLYCRSSPPPNALLYAVFLLNQNISQLKYILGLSRGDLRATLPNLYDILNIQSIDVLNRDVEPTFPAISMSASSSVDLNVPIPLNNLSMRMIESKSTSRICRSVDNYSDQSLSDNSNSKSRFSSEPILSKGQLKITDFNQKETI